MEYLLYASVDTGGILLVNKCFVFELRYAHEHLEALGEGESPVPGLEPPVPSLAPAEAGSDAGFPRWAIGLIGAAAAILVVGVGFAAISRRRARHT